MTIERQKKSGEFSIRVEPGDRLVLSDTSYDIVSVTTTGILRTQSGEEIGVAEMRRMVDDNGSVEILRDTQ